MHGQRRSRPWSQSTGSRRQISPDETDATCLLAGQHRSESYGGTRRRRRPSRPWIQAAASTNHKPPSSCTLAAAALLRPLVDLFSSACLCAARLSPSPCWLLGGQGACPTKTDAQRVSGGRRIPRAARAAQLDDLPHQATTIEFSSSFCAVAKRLGAASEATGMSGLGQVGGPSRPPMSPGGVIAGNARTACCCCCDAGISLHQATTTARVKVTCTHARLTAADEHRAATGEGEGRVHDAGAHRPFSMFSARATGSQRRASPLAAA
jgi:hypothetical protein